jgi:hypothetical protein
VSPLKPSPLGTVSEFPQTPGGPTKPEFREAIGRLAEQAQDEDRRAWHEAHRPRRRLSYFIRTGIVLILLEGILFLYLHATKQHEAAVSPAATRQILPPNSCARTLHRTYWQIVAYARESGHPPVSLDELVGKYVEKLPVDPASGKPLLYSTDGTQFDVRCPGAAPHR